MDLISVGRRRRRKELIRVSAIVFLVSFFLAAFLLYHSQMEEYENQRNIRLCGSWILEKEALYETPESLHPYVEKLGEVLAGVHVYCGDSGDAYENDTGLYIGTIPDNMSDIGNVRVYDGRLPEKDGEVALTLGALERLGLSYELGQQIEINYGKYYSHSMLVRDKQEQIYHTETYVVTGILYNYSDMWNTGAGMPSIIISEGDFDRLDAQKLHLGFYGLKGEYADVDTQFTGAVMGDDDTIHYNSNVYEAVLWDNGIANVWIVISVMVIGCCAMAYIIIQENKRRKNYYYRMRCIGATKGQIRAFSMQESVLTIIPAAAGGIVAAYAICAIVEFFISLREDIGYFYTFDVKALMRIIGAVFITMVVSLFASQCALMHRRIADNDERISTKRADRLRKKAAKAGRSRLITPAYTARRVNELHPIRTMLLRIVGIAVCSLVLYNITKIFNDVNYYLRVKKVYKDFVIQMPDEYRYKIQYEDKENNSVTTQDAVFYIMDNGLSDAAVKSIELVEGIERADYITEESTHKLSWDGMESGQYYKDMVDMLTNGGKCEYDDIYGELFCEVYYNNTERLWNDFSANIEWSGADYEKFSKGEQVFIAGDVSNDDSVEPGDIVHIETEAGNIDVEVAAVIPFELEMKYIDQGNGRCDMIGSDLLGRKVAAADGKEFKYTEAEILFDNYRDAELIAQQLSIIAVRSGGKYKAEYTAVKQQYNSLTHKLFMYGGFVAAVFFMYAVIRIGILKDDAEMLSVSRTRLKQAGADDGFVVKQAVSWGLKDGISLFIAIPVVMTVHGVIYVKEVIDKLSTNTKYTYLALQSDRLNRWFEYEPDAKAAIKLLPIKLLDLQYEWYLLFIILNIVLFTAVSVIMTWRELKAGQTD